MNLPRANANGKSDLYNLTFVFADEKNSRCEWWKLKKSDCVDSIWRWHFIIKTSHDVKHYVYLPKN